MSEFEDARLLAAMRAFLAATDALDEAAKDANGDRSRDVIDHADAKILAEMALRRHLETAGWMAPRETAAAADNGD
jgi:hypothetical protein